MTHASHGFTARYGEALTYAAGAHDGQLRKGTSIPYIHHPVAVSALVIEHGGTEDQAIAGLLHDVLEDCGGEHGIEIERRFGEDVLRIVQGLTDGVADSTGRKPEWRDRKELYLAHLSSAPDEVVLVSAADKLHNAMAISEDHAEIGDQVFDRFRASKSETIWYYQSLTARFGERLGQDHRLVRRLGAAMIGWATATGDSMEIGDREVHSDNGGRLP
jgi:(p)ppGpp synthase/HD superfamily hydrolase